MDYRSLIYIAYYRKMCDLLKMDYIEVGHILLDNVRTNRLTSLKAKCQQFVPDVCKSAAIVMGSMRLVIMTEEAVVSTVIPHDFDSTYLSRQDSNVTQFVRGYTEGYTRLLAYEARLKEEM
jgi:hypothetical protein